MLLPLLGVACGQGTAASAFSNTGAASPVTDGIMLRTPPPLPTASSDTLRRRMLDLVRAVLLWGSGLGSVFYSCWQ